MKYVTDHFTLEMIKEPTYTLVQKTIRKNIFKKNIKKAKSSITSGKIAYMLHKPKKHENIELKRGDEIYIVTNEYGRKHSCEYTSNKNFRFEVFSIQ